MYHDTYTESRRWIVSLLTIPLIPYLPMISLITIHTIYVQCTMFMWHAEWITVRCTFQLMIYLFIYLLMKADQWSCVKRKNKYWTLNTSFYGCKSMWYVNAVQLIFLMDDWLWPKNKLKGKSILVFTFISFNWYQNQIQIENNHSKINAIHWTVSFATKSFHKSHSIRF